LLFEIFVLASKKKSKAISKNKGIKKSKPQCAEKILEFGIL